MWYGLNNIMFRDPQEVKVQQWTIRVPKKKTFVPILLTKDIKRTMTDPKLIVF